MTSIFGRITEETPKHSELCSEPPFFVREYAPYICAKVTLPEENISQAFRILAGYIFGGNTKSESDTSSTRIAMTAPVFMSEAKSEKIDMTAPVLMSSDSGSKSGFTTMCFTMPSKFQSISELPKPKDDRIVFEQVEKDTVAVIKFNGRVSGSSNELFKKNLDLLRDWVNSQDKWQLKPEAKPQFAGYNPPWTIDRFRTNEILLPIIPK